MANIKGSIKRIHTNEKRRVRNASFKSGLKTAVRDVEIFVEENAKDKAVVALAIANKKLDKSVVKGINHKNYVARQKSRLAKLVNSL